MAEKRLRLMTDRQRAKQNATILQSCRIVRRESARRETGALSLRFFPMLGPRHRTILELMGEGGILVVDLSRPDYDAQLGELAVAWELVQELEREGLIQPAKAGGKQTYALTNKGQQAARNP
jgi:hypothetical protein